MHRSLPMLFLLACSPPEEETPEPIDPHDLDYVGELDDLTRFVDPMLGTDGPGNVIPGAVRPHGMVRASPDTLSEAGSIDAYEHGDGRIEGFTHTHLEGPGGSANGYSQLLLLPQTGARDLDRRTRHVGFDPATEVARPGYYRVVLDNGVEVELTATGHAAVHRYHFPAGPARLVLDLGHSNGDSVGSQATVDASGGRGSATYNMHPIAALVTSGDGRTAFSALHFHAELSEAASSFGSWRGRVDPNAWEQDGAISGSWAGGWWELDFAVPTTVEVRIGISSISPEQAATNLGAEVGSATFDTLADEAEAVWNARLNRVRIEGTEADKQRFYTAFYHTMLQPADYTETGGVYSTGYSGAPVTRQADGFHYVTDDWCMWDTFRTSHPLGALTEPEWRGDIATSMLVAYEEGGWLPKCTWNATGYSRVMIGNHAVPILADAVSRGIHDFDTDLAWQAIEHASMDEIELKDGLCGYVNLGTPPDYLELGYVPTECDPGQSVSMTLEHAYDDWAAARFAEATGRADEQAIFDDRGTWWRNTFNPEHGFAQARDRAGNWREPFDPAAWGDFNDFTEASSWIYSFFVPHDVDGLIEVMGGTEVFLERLDTFFADGHFDPSNQPSFHIPFLYAIAGAPERGQQRVRTVLEDNYGLGRGGLPGNDDAGSTSAWLVLASLGLYPLAPGDGVWQLTTPSIRGATLHLHPEYTAGGTVRIETTADPAEAPFIQRVLWNDVALEELVISHAELAQGGVLTFELSATAP